MLTLVNYLQIKKCQVEQICVAESGQLQFLLAYLSDNSVRVHVAASGRAANMQQGAAAIENNVPPQPQLWQRSKIFWFARHLQMQIGKLAVHEDTLTANFLTYNGYFIQIPLLRFSEKKFCEFWSSLLAREEIPPYDFSNKNNSLYAQQPGSTQQRDQLPKDVHIHKIQLENNSIPRKVIEVGPNSPKQNSALQLLNAFKVGVRKKSSGGIATTTPKQCDFTVSRWIPNIFVLMGESILLLNAVSGEIPLIINFGAPLLEINRMIVCVAQKQTEYYLLNEQAILECATQFLKGGGAAREGQLFECLEEWSGCKLFQSNFKNRYLLLNTANKLLKIYGRKNKTRAKYIYRAHFADDSVLAIQECASNTFLVLTEKKLSLISKYLLQRVNSGKFTTKEKILQNVLRHNQQLKELEDVCLGGKDFYECETIAAICAPENGQFFDLVPSPAQASGGLLLKSDGVDRYIVDLSRADRDFGKKFTIFKYLQQELLQQSLKKRQQQQSESVQKQDQLENDQKLPYLCYQNILIDLYVNEKTPLEIFQRHYRECTQYEEKQAVLFAFLRDYENDIASVTRDKLENYAKGILLIVEDVQSQFQSTNVRDTYTFRPWESIVLENSEAEIISNKKKLQQDHKQKKFLDIDTVASIVREKRYAELLVNIIAFYLTHNSIERGKNQFQTPLDNILVTFKLFQAPEKNFFSQSSLRSAIFNLAKTALHNKFYSRTLATLIYYGSKINLFVLFYLKIGAGGIISHLDWLPQLMCFLQLLNTNELLILTKKSIFCLKMLYLEYSLVQLHSLDDIWEEFVLAHHNESQKRLMRLLLNVCLNQSSKSLCQSIKYANNQQIDFQDQQLAAKALRQLKKCSSGSYTLNQIGADLIYTLAEYQSIESEQLQAESQVSYVKDIKSVARQLQEKVSIPVVDYLRLHKATRTNQH